MEFFGFKEMMVGLWLVLLGMAISAGVRGHHTLAGKFISIDCGIPDGSNYTDDGTDIQYTSDAKFIDTGVNQNISANYMATSFPRQLSSLRSFPVGPRNCYTLKPVEQGWKYLVRASFLHGNYDGCCNSNTDVSILFDLHLGVNLWKAINISNTSSVFVTETITFASADFISVCLINKDHGTPFISSLELRTLESTLYPEVNPTTSLVLGERFDFGAKGGILRHPTDPMDRIWYPFRNDNWSDISTTNEVDHSEGDNFEVPPPVLQTAVVPVNSTELDFQWQAGSSDETRLAYYFFMHFAEIEAENSRTFNIHLNGKFWKGPVTPPYLTSYTVNTTSPETNLYWYNISLLATPTSIRPPSINALEVYSVMVISANETNAQDVEAMMAIKEHYKVKRNWMGDPCGPLQYVWSGLDCGSIANSDKLRITILNLSSSGLTGDIIDDFAKLKAIQNLDLSYNNLTGSIPGFFAELSSLKVLNLTGNKFSGSIPSDLLKRNSTGSLTFSVDVVGLCENSCEIKKKKITIPILEKVLLPVLVLLGVGLVLMVFIVYRMRRRQQGLVPGITSRLQNKNSFPQQGDHGDHPLQSESRQFTYMELQKITNNFKDIIGKGGFGNVFLGYLEDGTQVAVKTRSQSSTQGTKEFLAEAKLLTRVHHRNLVSLVGYCKDGNCLALVFEYMSQGSLHDHLRGKHAEIRVLTWRERLQIALESAQGLEYLHTGCRPTIVHRDVKTSNILLNQNLEAKLADFGLSKAFWSTVQSHISTAIVGTPGYLDPEYFQTYQLNEKSDVYSFGVVLLELITGQPPLLPMPGEGHIVQRVGPKVAQGNIDDVVDARLRGEYDVNSVWKAVDVALMCTVRNSVRRATMADVVMQLKESLALQIAWEQQHHTEAGDTSPSNDLEIAHVENISVVGGPLAR